MKIIKEIDRSCEIGKYLDIFNSYSPGIDYGKIKNEEVIFFDIETTGLSAKNTNLYLIGYVFFEDNKWKYCQLFGESPKCEEELLLEFRDVTSKYKYLVHFNGNGFDIPYINQKCDAHGIDHYLDGLESLDLYLLVRDFKNELGLSNCRQKTIEDLLRITRDDKFNGGELIPQYWEYVRTKSKELEHNLLLHNAEDCMGMLKLLDITDYIKLINIFKTCEFEIEFEKKDAREKCNLAFSMNLSDAKQLEKLNSKMFVFRNYVIKIDKDKILFETEIEEGCMKHFFPDIQNYYFIPSEDKAILKTLAKVLPSDMRERATKATCYAKKSGMFMPCLGEVTGELSFKHEYKDSANYILFADSKKIISENDLTTLMKESIKNI